MSTDVVRIAARGYVEDVDTPIDDVLALRVLAEPMRAKIYDHLAATQSAHTRQEVAEALDIGRTLVAFHFDKLEQAGLIKEATAEENSPGRPGRPPQRYRVVHAELRASIPPRRYEVLAEVLIQAASEQGPGEQLAVAAMRVACRRGQDFASLPGNFGGRSSADRTAVIAGLRQFGYGPSEDGTSIVLTNCPFQRLRDIDVELVCSLNGALIAGYLNYLGATGLVPRLRPCPTNCCVVVDKESA